MMNQRFSKAAFLILLACAVPAARGQTSECADCILDGRVGAELPGKGFVPATSAKVYVFYESEFINNGMRDRHIEHVHSFYTAGGQFHGHYVEFMDKDRELKPLLQKKRKKQELSDEEAMLFAEHSLKHVDEAITATIAWATKHPNDAWQVKVIEPNYTGEWTTGVIKPGGYQIVARGTVSQLDADWEYEVDLEPDRKTSKLGGQPKLFRPIAR